MNLKIPIGLIILSIVAILMDCHAGYAFFLMTVMSIGPDYPLLFFGTTITLLLLFFASIIGLFRLKKWAYNVFVTLTLIFNSLMLLIYAHDLMKGYSTFRNRFVFSVIFLFTFIIYFLNSSVRKLFK